MYMLHYKESAVQNISTARIFLPPANPESSVQYISHQADETSVFSKLNYFLYFIQFSYSSILSSPAGPLLLIGLC